MPLHLSPTDGVRVASHHLRGLAMIGQDPLPQQTEILTVCDAVTDDPEVATLRRPKPTQAQGDEQLYLLAAPTRRLAADVATTVGIPRYRSVTVCVGRRAAKSSSLWALALGRCDSIAGYQVFIALQSGVKGYERFLATARDLEFYDAGGPGQRYRILRGAGSPRIEWANGSNLFVVPPKAEAFRSSAAHLLILDEAQEHDLVATADLVAGALPILDTEPAGQVIVAGTARHDTRSGLLWDYLAAARKAPERMGIVEYAASEDADLDDEDVWIDAHPGPTSGLTRIEVLRERRDTMPAERFRAEYLGVWGYDATTAAVDLDAWKRLVATRTIARRPATGLVFAADCAPDGSRASIVLAWRRPDGDTVVELLEHKPGTHWVAKTMYDLHRAHRGSLLVWDSIGENIAAMAPLDRVSPKPKVADFKFDDVKGATAAMLQRIAAGTVHHLDQPDLNAAVEVAALRQVGESRVWARLRSDGDVTAIVAATEASWIAAGLKPRAPRKIRSAA